MVDSRAFISDANVQIYTMSIMYTILEKYINRINTYKRNIPFNHFQIAKSKNPHSQFLFLRTFSAIERRRRLCTSQFVRKNRPCSVCAKYYIYIYRYAPSIESTLDSTALQKLQSFCLSTSSSSSVFISIDSDRDNVE